MFNQVGKLKMDYLTKLLPLFLLATLLPSGCAASSVHRQTSQTCQWVTRNPSQPVVLSAQGSTVGPVVALDFAADTGNLTAIYASIHSKLGQVMVWGNKTGEVVQQRTIAWIDPQLTALSLTNNMLVTVDDRSETITQHRQEFNSPDSVIKLIEIWNVTTGKQQKLLPLYDPGYYMQEIAVSYNGHQILEVSSLNASLDSTNPLVKQHGESIPTVTMSEDPNYVPDDFAVGAFDQNGRLFAVGFDSGVVWLRKLTGELSSVADGSLWPSVEHGNQKTIALAFDAKGDWFAILRPNSIELRNLRSWFTFLWPPFDRLWPVRIASNLPATDVGKVAFSPDGTVLAIGTPHGWQLRRTSDLTLVTEQIDVNITSLAFSGDGCVVAFGTQDGAIQVWSVPTP
jgi:WD40 repeat protein